jgi:hypothetical protein
MALANQPETDFSFLPNKAIIKNPIKGNKGTQVAGAIKFVSSNKFSIIIN